jgi:hypothetical protein
LFVASVLAHRLLRAQDRRGLGILRANPT